MRRVLITGAGGFIGRALVRRGQDLGWTVLSVTRRDLNLPNQSVIDFQSPDLNRLMRNLPSVDAVVHLGCEVGWDLEHGNRLIRPNVLAAAEWADWAGKQNAHFLFASAALIAGIGTRHIHSSSPPEARHPYLKSKWIAEEIIRLSGVRHTILRIAGVFGKDGPDHLTLNRSISGVLRGIPPVLAAGASARRNYIYVKDVARLFEYCILNSVEGTHLAAGSSVNTLREMLETICSILRPGMELQVGQGTTVWDQTIEHSRVLPAGRTFEAAIRDIGNDALNKV